MSKLDVLLKRIETMQSDLGVKDARKRTLSLIPSRSPKVKEEIERV